MAHGCYFLVFGYLAKSAAAPEEAVGGAQQQQLGVLDQQLRKLLASPGLPAVSPISLPFSAAANGEGWVCQDVGQASRFRCAFDTHA